MKKRDGLFGQGVNRFRFGVFVTVAKYVKPG
jgi:hypothetical protein